MVLEKLREILAEQFDVNEQDITRETTFADDLGADPLDMVELSMILEEEFDIEEIDEQTAAKIETVGDIIRLIGDDE